MMKGADSPYWKDPQYKTLTANEWDVVVIQLGTNDARNSFWGTSNWPLSCTNPDALSCPFGVDYAAMIDVVRTLGRPEHNETGPEIFLSVPPPLMKNMAYGMNQTVINDFLPSFIPKIAAANKIPAAKVISVFEALGGESKSGFPVNGCTIQNCKTLSYCKYYCGAITCDQCHPSDEGYGMIAATVAKALTKSVESSYLRGRQQYAAAPIAS
mmetsp:Transcript_38116/g.88711  ORF Transcript_38116/g.88711 Transcript_38116/m.88711 type:complete len:212 (+) Transcript_38116:481-1116(+)|eukprot:CAMPEP_0113330104 /NCGR_PEP_ID=MMETSP0010_2-20120614/21387_1 /TAXON_ID=216773 ORGANISM="Corethron hystrix, Strain 308" /NCGR_SAMPLE_ID=MMETSP0010_2 /ASSEMBLY_ACC=CAM_ASM_000155 /LENGTH=211 /DNA_ID=CAMNT_0000192501 /DNA_START=284 /DNA_END=919 /DNA_ORIENTATION=+ /assembly_acc=CAM_ASM_000155